MSHKELKHLNMAKDPKMRRVHNQKANNTSQCERTGGGEDKSVDKRTRDEIGKQNYNQ